MAGTLCESQTRITMLCLPNSLIITLDYAFFRRLFKVSFLATLCSIPQACTINKSSYFCIQMNIHRHTVVIFSITGHSHYSIINSKAADIFLFEHVDIDFEVSINEKRLSVLTGWFSDILLQYGNICTGFVRSVCFFYPFECSMVARLNISFI